MTENIERRRRLLYGRRKGPKLSAHQTHLRETLLPRLSVQLEKGRDPRTYFSPPPCGEVAAVVSVSERRDAGGSQNMQTHPHPTTFAPLMSSTSPQGGGERRIDDVWLEVGFGAGEHLLWQAQQHLNIGLIGAEPYESGVAKLLTKLDSLSPRTGGEGKGEGVSTPCSVSPPHPDPLPRGGRGSNVRIYEGDARDIIEALPDASIGRFFILFPDPWPKTRHHKRRFIQMEMLDQLARILRPGAELRFATDDKSYLPYALERLMAHPKFAWTADCIADWTGRPADWPQTRYEAKAIKGPPVFLRFKRR